MPKSFAFLTDRRNLALAVNTNDYPGTEVRMWYNPDVMENRQRAIFMAGCDFLFPELVTVALGLNITKIQTEVNEDEWVVNTYIPGLSDGTLWVTDVQVNLYDASGELIAEKMVMDYDEDNAYYNHDSGDVASYDIILRSYYGGEFVIKNLK